ncbi:MAG: zinc ribbon domain-containing protein [Proteobacteria bacterium]|nr:zinc ribbon domain-containing protein [Pseudomonadota bacterium]
MPTYSYKCSKCGFVFDVFKKMSDNSDEKCPRCGALASKTISQNNGGVIFKGHGFYITDYKNKKSSLSNNISKTVDKK